ncbi:hypothetical protein RvVAR0630_18490 [Agrobacterium vitis]|nr:hypothetical protein [Agrobacterium vitis]BCH59225.1 hypothetical protein RvVAR0630_18490 [Agrobacterium vitis]
MDTQAEVSHEAINQEELTLADILAEANLLPEEGDEERLATAVKAIAW